MSQRTNQRASEVDIRMPVGGKQPAVVLILPHGSNCRLSVSSTGEETSVSARELRRQTVCVVPGHQDDLIMHPVDDQWISQSHSDISGAQRHDFPYDASTDYIPPSRPFYDRSMTKPKSVVGEQQMGTESDDASSDYVQLSRHFYDRSMTKPKSVVGEQQMETETAYGPRLHCLNSNGNMGDRGYPSEKPRHLHRRPRKHSAHTRGAPPVRPQTVCVVPDHQDCFRVNPVDDQWISQSHSDISGVQRQDFPYGSRLKTVYEAPFIDVSDFSDPIPQHKMQEEYPLTRSDSYYDLLTEEDYEELRAKRDQPYRNTENRCKSETHLNEHPWQERDHGYFHRTGHGPERAHPQPDHCSLPCHTCGSDFTRSMGLISQIYSMLSEGISQSKPNLHLGFDYAGSDIIPICNPNGQSGESTKKRKWRFLKKWKSGSKSYQ